MSYQFEELYREDLKHIKRWEQHYTDKEFYAINKKIRKKLEKLLKKKKKLTGRENFVAAIILHHRFTIKSSKQALKYAKKALELGYKRQKWLKAAIIDRLLQLQGKPQKYGTQIIKLKSGKIKQYKLDDSITDIERKTMGLPTLKQLKRYLES